MERGHNPRGNEGIQAYLLARADTIYGMKYMGNETRQAQEYGVSTSGTVVAPYDNERVVLLTFVEADFRSTPEGMVYVPLQFDLQLVSKGSTDESVQTYAYRLHGQPQPRIERITVHGAVAVDIARDTEAEWQIEDMLNVVEASTN